MQISKTFRVGQKVIFLNQNKEILVIRFASNSRIPAILHGKWDFPGGGLEWGESLVQGLSREIQEELGNINYKIKEPFFIWDWIHNEKNQVRTVCALYEANFLGGEIMLNEEHDRYEWVKVRDLKNFDWHQDDLVAVNKIMEKFI